MVFMVNGILGYSTYYNNNESLIRGVNMANEAEKVTRNAIPVNKPTDTAQSNATNYGGFSKSIA